MTNLEEKLIRLCYGMVDIHPSDRFKHWTFLIRRNRILNVSMNHPLKTHPLSKKHGYRFGLHSEVANIAATPMYKNDYANLKIYNVRINNLGEISNSRPCVNCDTVLRLFNFRDVYFTGDDGQFHHWDD